MDGDGAGVALAECRAADLQRLSEERFGGGVTALVYQIRARLK